MTLATFDLIWWNATTSTHSCVELPLFFFLFFLSLFSHWPFSLSIFLWQSFNKQVGSNRKALWPNKVCSVHTVFFFFLASWN